MKIVSRTATPEYRENFDAIFGKKADVECKHKFVRPESDNELFVRCADCDKQMAHVDWLSSQGVVRDEPR